MSTRESVTDDPYRLQLLQRQRQGAQSAATLTYKVAPLPDDDDVNSQVHMALLAESDRQIAAAAQTSAAGRWLWKAWESAKSFAQENVVAMRQAAFLRHFSRQLEANAEEWDVVLCSARCALVSMGTLIPGLLFVTNWGLYFVSEEAAAADGVVATAANARSATPTPSPSQVSLAVARATAPLPTGVVVATAQGAATAADVEPGSLRTDQPVHQASVVRAGGASSPTTTTTTTPDTAAAANPCSTFSIKERVGFSRVASLLPSITRHATSTGDAASGPLYFEGIPSAQAEPTALQIFTVAPRQIYQILAVSDIVIKPPAPPTAVPQPTTSTPSPTADGTRNHSFSAPPVSRVRDLDTASPFEDVVKPLEFPLFKSMPAHKDTFRLVALMWRLWRARLTWRNQPLLHPDAVYAEPH